jgi:ADP-heptose:LPS heptosyltransferase
MGDLVILPSRLGDFLQAGPLLSAIREDGGGLTLAVASPGVAQAAALSGLAARIVTLSPEEIEKGEADRLPKSPDRLWCLSLHRPTLNLAGSLAAKEIFGPRLAGDRIALSPAQSLAMAVMGLDRRLGRLNLVDIWRDLSPVAAPRELAWPKFDPDPELQSLLLAKKAQGKALLGLQLGCGNRQRRYPVERFAKFAALARKSRPLSPVLLGESREAALGKRFRALLAQEDPEGAEDTLDLIGKTDLRSLGETIRTLALFVSADTGAMHLAAALKAPILGVFFGPALGHETGPYVSGATVLQGLAPCGPCPESPACPRMACRALPSPESLYRAALDCLDYLDQPGEPEKKPHSPGAPVSYGSHGSPISSASPLPPYLSLWQTRIGHFGHKLVPQAGSLEGLPAEDRAFEEYALGLCLREAGQAALSLGCDHVHGLGHEFGHGPEKAGRISPEEIQAYGPENLARAAQKNRKKFLKALSFVARKAFLEQAEERDEDERAREGRAKGRERQERFLAAGEMALKSLAG